jgi:hypothetical protein
LIRDRVCVRDMWINILHKGDSDDDDDDDDNNNNVRKLCSCFLGYRVFILTLPLTEEYFASIEST